MTTTALWTPVPTLRAPARAERVAPRTWARIRQTVTAGVFIAATVAGVILGVQAPAVSPVSPATAAGAPVITPTPAAVVPPPAAPDAATQDGAGRTAADQNTAGRNGVDQDTQRRPNGGGGRASR